MVVAGQELFADIRAIPLEEGLARSTGVTIRPSSQDSQPYAKPMEQNASRVFVVFSIVDSTPFLTQLIALGAEMVVAFQVRWETGQKEENAVGVRTVVGKSYPCLEWTIWTCRLPADEWIPIQGALVHRRRAEVVAVHSWQEATAVATVKGEAFGDSQRKSIAVVLERRLEKGVRKFFAANSDAEAWTYLAHSMAENLGPLSNVFASIHMHME